MGTMLQAADPRWRTWKGTRAATRSSTSPARTSCAPSTTPTSRPAPTWSRPTPSAPTSATSASTASSTGSASWPRPGARVAREAADAWSTDDPAPLGHRLDRPGTKLPSLGHAPYASLRDGYQEQVAGMLAGGVDLLLVETVQDLLQARAAVVGARRAMAAGRGDPAGLRPGHRRDDRHHAARHRDARRPHGAARPARRRGRPQLRDRARRDGRAPAPPVPARRHGPVASCRTPACPCCPAAAPTTR